MSDYPTQEAIHGAVEEYSITSFICSTQNSNICEDEEYIANFDLDLLAAELLPESSVEGAASDSASSEGIFNATSLLGLGAVIPNDIFNSRRQPSHTTDEYVPYQYCEQQYSSSYFYQPQLDLSQYDDKLGESFQQKNISQPYDQHCGYVYHNDQQMGVYQQPHRQSGISYECDQQSDVSGSVTSKKRKGYRHRHQRQFLSSVEERDQRSRVFNNEVPANYRRKMHDLHNQARMALDNLEQGNQQLTQRFRLLQKFCSHYSTRMEALRVPARSSC
ncbi:uncharacterized protein LOC125031800 [Penaeus chinensis]|uniref:uncharacterized protein LOC125031800 n=1 Tax=Penaeus chinensis TaxID=139456 RepID=UPI001FB67DDF|nr:uncharacterized protein LOC125031800 [Penaeus chinensis]